MHPTFSWTGSSREYFSSNRWYLCSFLVIYRFHWFLSKFLRMSNVLLDHTLTYFEANKLKMVLLDLVGIVRFLFYPKGTFQLLLLQFQISNLALSPLFLFLDFLGFVIFRTVRILLKSSRKYTLFPTRRLMTYILSAVHFHQRIRTKAQEHNTS